MRKLNIKHQYLIGLIITIMVGILFDGATEFSGPIRNVNANQTLMSSSQGFSRKGLDLVAFSPDGNSLASAELDGQIMLSDVASGQVRMTLPSQFATTISGITFSPDGNTLASVSDSSIRLWNAISGETLLNLPGVGPVNDLAFSPDGKSLAALGADSRITIWNSTSGSVVQVLPKNAFGVNAIAFSPNSKTIAIGTQDGQIKLWNGPSKLRQLTLPSIIGNAVTDLLFSPDGKTLAVLGQDTRITLWNSVSETTMEILTNHQGGVNAIAFSPDSNIIATGGKDAQIKLWNKSTGLEKSTLNGEGVAVTDLVFSPDGENLVSIGESASVFLWNLSTKLPERLTGHTDWLGKVIFSANQKNLVSVGNTGQVVVWDLMTGLEQTFFQVPSSSVNSLISQGLVAARKSPSNSISKPVNALTTAPVMAIGNSQTNNGLAGNQNARGINKRESNHNWKGVTSLAISPDGKLFGGTTKDGTVRLWATNGTERFTNSGHHGTAVTGVTFSADGKRLVSVGRDSEIQINDVLSGKMSQALLAHEGPIRAVASSQDGKYFASVGEETRVMLWDANSGKLLKIFSGLTSFGNDVKFSMNGKVLAVGGADSSIKLWDVETGKLTRTMLGHSGEVNTIAFSRDGQFLASGGTDSQVILWDIITGKQVQIFAGHQAAVRAVAFSPNGNRLASTGEDTRILVWDTSTFKVVSQISGAANAINALVFNPLGNLIAGSEDGTVKEWDVEKGKTKKIINVPIQPQVNNFNGIVESPLIVSSQSIISSAKSKGQDRDQDHEISKKTESFQIMGRLLDWLIPAAEASINKYPSGPILVVTTLSDPFSQYYAEILRTEGFNEFVVADISTVDAATLANYDLVVLAPMILNGTQVSLLSTWVTGDSLHSGGNLIAIKPDPQLAGLLGLVPAGGTASTNGYLLVDTTQSPGNGIANQTIQYHGAADLYSLDTGTISIATLYSNATTLTSKPAVTLRSVGANGGQAAAFTYDVGRSIIYTRQGNPAWATQERDGYAPVRSGDKFYGNAATDPQKDWVDLSKVAVPQADEQQRLLANLITQMNLSKKPLPRFWYFPNGKKAVVIMTGDDHGNGGTGPRFDEFISLSPVNCVVANWECIRGTSYIFVQPANLSNTQAASYTAAGFEVGLHINTNCADYTPATLESFYTQQISNFTTNYPGIPAPITQRHHCIAWSDWITGAQTELNHGIRLDTSYYYWPPGWVGNQPGNFTGSAMPMRFVDLSGNIVDVFQAASQMTDESGQIYPFTIDTLLDRALGAEGYYGAYTINAHTDLPQITEATDTVSSAIARKVPVVSSVQMLNWLDARDASYFGALSWNLNTLSFSVTKDVSANGLQGMIPTHSATGLALKTLSGPSGNVSYTIDSIKGIEYAFFPAFTGAYVATYGVDTLIPTVLSTLPVNTAISVNPLNGVSATFSKGMNAATIGSGFELRDINNTLVPATISYNGTNRTATLMPSSQLIVQSTYTAKITGGSGGVKDLSGNSLATDYTWTFTTGALSNSGWSGAATPVNASENDPNPVELGVKFKTDTDGLISGIRFYKGTGNSGTHIGNLWDSNGIKLATATFANETTTGWQQVTFLNPVPVKAGLVYVASYFAPNGHYAGDNSFFSNSGVDNAPVHLLQNGVSGGNGVYIYGASSAFPNQTYQSTNYWVDVLFTPGAFLNVVSTTPTSGETGVSPGADTPQVVLNASFSNTLNLTTITSSTFLLKDSSNIVIPTTINAIGNTATIITTAALKPSSAYTATLTTGIKDINGNSLPANYTWSFTTGVALANCITPPNPIVAENCLPGNPSSEWEVSGGADIAGDPTIQGFATDISVNQSGTVNFKINTPISIPYRLDIYRMGYYSGAGARKVATVNPAAALVSQPACLNDSATGLIDCGNWAVSASWTVPANAVSGIYFARAVRTDTGGASHIVFIVRNDTSHSGLLFQTSDTSWTAYNDYGGNNLYTGSPGVNPARAYKVSYNRPFHTRVFEPESWLFNAEYPMVRWLEANGYDVSYFSGVDTERNAALIKNHKVWLSNGHDEYWSAGQRASIEAARDAGVHLAFFSSNTMFWKTRWENSIDASGAPYRTLVCYKETHANAKIDPLDPPTWTGTWRDPRFSPPLGLADGGKPENALKGTLFRMNGGQNGTIQVPQAEGQMRFWRNTSIAILGTGQIASLAPGTIGAEFDTDEDNGFRPAGLFGLSNTSITDSSNYLLDYGSTYGSGTVIHKLTLYKAPSGAWVFSTNTYQWAWGLDANHDRSSFGPTIDIRMQQATVNLFADMGIQPTTLQGGIVLALASTDVVAPVSSVTSPNQGSAITIGNTINITGTATDSGGVIGAVEVSVDGGNTWHPATGRGSWSYTWTPNLSGAVVVKTRAVDDSGNLEIPGVGVNVTVGSAATSCTTNCSIWPSTSVPSLVDGGPDSSVELGVKFKSDVSGNITGIRFYKASTNTGIHVGNLWSTTNTTSPLATATFTGETASGWQQVNFASPVPITAGTVYIASYHSNAGHYSADLNYFASVGVDNLPLHALANSLSPNSVFAYGATSIFPNQTWNSTNYWVDVVFSTGVAPTLNSISVTPSSANILTGNTQQFSATGTYSDGSMQNLTNQVAWASANTTVATLNASGLASGIGNGATTISALQGGISGSSNLTVQASLAINTTSLPSATVGTVYSTTLAASGGASPYIWSIASGALPVGLSLSASGVISGTPTVVGTSSVIFQVSDSSNSLVSVTKALSIVVANTVVNTNFLVPTANVVVTSSAGDNNGFETNPINAYVSDGLFAVDTNSGTNTNTSCTNSGKDKHNYYNYNFSVPVGAIINGIEVQLTAKVNRTSSSPFMCVQLSWNGGATWTATKRTPTLSTVNATYTLGGGLDTWSHVWAAGEFLDANFRVRIIDVASSTARTFSLDKVAVRVTYQ
jgi:WD40 repeat protein